MLGKSRDGELVKSGFQWPGLDFEGGGRGRVLVRRKWGYMIGWKGVVGLEVEVVGVWCNAIRLELGR